MKLSLKKLLTKLLTPVVITFELTTNTSIITDANVQTNRCHYVPLLRMVYIEYMVYSPGQKIPGQNRLIATVPAAYKYSGSIQCGFAEICTSAYDPTHATYEKYYIADGNIQMNNFMTGQNCKMFGIKTIYFR